LILLYKYVTKSGNIKFLLLVTAIITNLFAINNVSFSQGRRDIDGSRFVNFNYYDTSRYKIIDTTASKLDTTKLAPVDSTSRIKYFTYVPKYSFGVQSNQSRNPILLDNSSLIKYEVTYDSSNKIIIRQTFMNKDVKAPLVLSLPDYLKIQSEINRKSIFNNIFSEKFKGNVTDDLTKIFEKFTDITIPLPFKTETIFGPPTFNLRLNGMIDITASYQNIKSDQEIISYNTNTQNNINFKQDVQVKATGMIGDKLTIDADWNTTRTFDFENQLKLKYTGYPDEVIQKIEAGNVSLDTKSRLIQSTQALFGIKGEFKLGPLTISSVISQKKSKQEQKDYKGGAVEQSFIINIFDYSDNHYFVDTLYRSRFIDVFNHTPDQYSDTTIRNQIIIDQTNFEVWVQTETTERDKRYALAYTQLWEKVGNNYDTINYSQQVQGVKFFGYFRKLNQTEYTVNTFAGFVSLRVNVPENYAVGVTYKTYENKKFGYNSSEKDTLLLKMIKCANQSPDTNGTPVAWKLKLKNIYRLPVSRVVEDGFTLDAFYISDNVPVPTVPNPNNKRILEITGLDRYTGKTRRTPADQIFDFLPGTTIITETGDIIFPSLRPFDDNLRFAGVDTSLGFPGLYDKRKNVAQNEPIATKYILKGTAKGEAGISNTINLGFNIVQGSVRVFIGQQELVNNVDYTVDYATGIVVIRSQSALSSKDLRVQYETNDLLSLASKTLIGTRADYKINEKTNLGFTFLNLKQETLNDKVRIGEEPTNNSVFGLDFTTEIKSNFLTKMINLLPGYNTKEESVFTFNGEIAYLTPDPNTMKSRIPQDNNQSIAYIDDMEGAKKLIPLGTSFSTWTMSSLPLDDSIGFNDFLKQFKRGRMLWFNVVNDVDVRQIYPLRDVQPGQDRITPFYVVFDPTSRGTYNYNLHMDTVQNKKTNWNGIMKYLNSSTPDLVNENINYIEFNMKVDGMNNTTISQGQLIIDLGTISEDALPNGILDTEDKNQNGNLEPQFDLGLDGIIDNAELDTLNRINGTNYTMDQYEQLYGNRDPALDNNSNNPGVIDYNLINGTENNRFIEGGNKPDTEDLDRDGSVNLINSYFEYVVSLDTTNNKRISGRGAPGSGWFQYRVPLSEFTKNVNSATLTNVRYVRVWIKGVDGKIKLAMVDFNLVGNQWFKPDKNDTTYNISVVSIEENSQIYMSPVGGDVLRQTIHNQNGVNTKSNEQSLSIQVNNLVTGQRKIAVKDYRSQTLDLFNYKVMKLFVNGDPSFSYVNDKIYDAIMVVRFGSDSNNFYEYRAPIHPDTRPGQPWNSLNEVTIVFADLTSIKISRDSVNQVLDMPVPNGPPGSYYRVKGNPALNVIREIEIGVEKSRSALNSTITGSVWFNEIRVLKVNDDNGYAYSLNANMKLADLANFSFNFSKVDPNFHSLDTRYGNRNTGINWDFSLTFNFHKIINNALVSIFNENWKDFINLPVTFRHSENIINPVYYPGSDIDVDKAALELYNRVLNKTNDPVAAQQSADALKIESQSLGVRNEISINGMQFKLPGSNYFFENILNKIVINFAGQFGTARDFTYRDKFDFTYTGGINFTTDFGLADKFSINLNKIINLGEDYKDAKFYFFMPFLPALPLFSSQFTATTDFNRTRNESQQRRLLNPDPTGRLFTANRGFSFNWKFLENWIIDLTGSYQFRVSSDLTGLETNEDSLRTQRSEKEIFKDIFLNEGLVNFGRDLNYQQTNQFNPKFNIPFLKKFLDLQASYNVTYAWQNPNTVVNTGYSVGYQNQITAGTNFKIKELFNLFAEGRVQRVLANSGNSSGIMDDKKGLDELWRIIKTLIPDNVNINISQTNQVGNGGVDGRPGFGNFWMMPYTREQFGPSRLYQLGMSLFPGKRVPGLQITDIYNQTNNINFTASIRPIIPENISMNLTFKTNWGFNNSATYVSNQNGELFDPTTQSGTSTKGYSMFFAGKIDKFTFESTSDVTADTKNIADAFKKNMASFPFPNWTMTITGVEKFPLFAEFATSVTIDNSFTSEYSEGFATDITGTRLPQRQGVTQSFSPLFGLNITFKSMFEGNLTAQFRYNSSVTNNLVPSSRLVQVTDTKDWSLSANFAKAGFEIPFFGLSLKNDITFSLTISKNTNNPADYQFVVGKNSPDYKPNNGSAVTTINPSIQYSLSSKVQMQVFYKYIRTEPTQNTVNTVPRTSNEGGLNFKIQIQ
jgi:hypothetical protein